METSKAILTIVGVPLDDEGTLSAEARATLEAADLVIGETRKGTYRFLKQIPDCQSKEVLLLDPPREASDLPARLKRAAQEGSHVALVSDCGVPLLFDPGGDVLSQCRELGFTIRSAPGPTSWGMACALSGLKPPFYLYGFLPRDASERLAALRDLKAHRAHVVLMDTPYRFKLLLNECREALGEGKLAFLAWEIGRSTEHLEWGSIADIARSSQARGQNKGEFVLILQGHASTPR